MGRRAFLVRWTQLPSVWKRVVAQTSISSTFPAVQGYDGQKSFFGAVDTELLYGKEGWCEAAQPKYQCPCVQVGGAGREGRAGVAG